MIVEEEKLLYDINLINFTRKFLEKMESVAAESSLKSFSISFL